MNRSLVISARKKRAEVTKLGRSGLSISSKIDHFVPFSLVNSAKLKNSRFDRNINRHNWKLLGLHREVLQCPKPLLHLSDGNKYQSMANLNVQICYYISHNLRSTPRNSHLLLLPARSEVQQQLWALAAPHVEIFFNVLRNFLEYPHT